MVTDLSKMNQGVSKYLMALVKEIMEPMTKQLLSSVATTNAFAKIVSTGLFMVLDETLGLIPGPTVVFNAIRKAYKTARMTYKLANRGVQLQRRLVRICKTSWLEPT